MTNNDLDIPDIDTAPDADDDTFNWGLATYGLARRATTDPRYEGAVGGILTLAANRAAEHIGRTGLGYDRNPEELGRDMLRVAGHMAVLTPHPQDSVLWLASYLAMRQMQDALNDAHPWMSLQLGEFIDAAWPDYATYRRSAPDALQRGWRLQRMIPQHDPVLNAQGFVRILLLLHKVPDSNTQYRHVALGKVCRAVYTNTWWGIARDRGENIGQRLAELITARPPERKGKPTTLPEVP